MLKWIKKLRGSLRRSRGSVLVIVVAILMMIALIGTAYIATARLDRYAAQEHVRITQAEIGREQYAEYVQRLVLKAIVDDFGNNITSPRRLPWLGERLPKPVVLAKNAPPAPYWRFISGKLDNRLENADYVSPLASPSYGENMTLKTGDRPGALPTSVTLMYPPDYPVEKYRSKVRTFPAIQFGGRNSTTSAFTAATDAPGPFLAADADGDGIADSALCKLTPAPLNGVTYYYAIRIIDNSSAINVNTAWRRDGDVLANGSLAQNKGFFVSNIGLRELFMPDPNNSGKDPAAFQMRDVNAYRFGYCADTTTIANTEPENKPFADVNAWEDQDDTGSKIWNQNKPDPQKRNDFQFGSQSEALAMQSARRLRNPGLNQGAEFPYRPFPDDNGASLAYRFCMLPLDTDMGRLQLSDLESQFHQADPDVNDPNTMLKAFDAVVRAAPNYSIHSLTENLNHFRYFPANEPGLWFQYVDLDGGLTFPDPLDSKRVRVRPLRPILVTHSAATSRIIKKGTPANWDKQSGSRYLINPGMVFADGSKRFRGIWRQGEKYVLGDFVIDSNDQMGYMFIRRNSGGTDPRPSEDKQINPQAWDRQPLVTGETKTSINTAGFPDLWRAFFQVMCDRKMPNAATPVDGEVSGMITANTYFDPYHGMKRGASVENYLRMYRSVIRDPRSVAANNRTHLTPLQVAALRSALAAVNTMALMDQTTDNVPTRRITLYDIPDFENPVPAFEATVFGVKPQPYITEVYANSDTHKYVDDTHCNKVGYIAIELYNPYGRPISLKGWKVAIFDRTKTGAYGSSSSVLTEVHKFADSDTIPAESYVVLENFDEKGGKGSAKYRPPSARTPTGTTIYMEIATDKNDGKKPNAFNRELIILRPTVAGMVNQAFFMVPVDQFDFTGLVPSSDMTPTKKARTWHYVRKTNEPWKFVYPGRYDGSQDDRRHDGTEAGEEYEQWKFDPGKTEAENKGYVDRWNPTSGVLYPFQSPVDPKSPVPPITLGAKNDNASYTKTFAIQLNTPGMPGPAIDSSKKPIYPYGGFARNGDILQVPYIGSYCIRRMKAGGSTSEGQIDLGQLAAAPQVILEMNAVSIDSAFAEDTRSGNDADEQVGRFCPIRRGYNNYDNWYEWTTSLFNYLDVLVPSDDYLPNINPLVYRGKGVPIPVASTGGFVSNANQDKDDRAPLHGKINPNTAPRCVLAMLPFVPQGRSGTNEGLAQAIVDYRDGNPGNRPFETLFDLNDVPGFQRTITGPTTVNDGDVLAGSGGSSVADDFKARFMMLNRISNLVTTRSDTFTCYIVVQGWREAGTILPCLDWEKREAFIVERSSSTGRPRVTPVPAD